MPIYAYRCDECGFAKDVLQKMSDPVLTVCPSCGKSSFKKQVTAAGFQLKGTGWYVTDFRGGSTAPATGSAPPGEASTSGGGNGGQRQRRQQRQRGFIHRCWRGRHQERVGRYERYEQHRQCQQHRQHGIGRRRQGQQHLNAGAAHADGASDQQPTYCDA